MLQTYTLREKKTLTSDVFLLKFSIDTIVTNPLHWQFITFILPNGLWGRAYSILNFKDGIFELIIKRLENGKWGSKYICDLPVGWELKGVGAAWHFVLQKNNKNKLFLWTGTWFVPLYYQILGSIENVLDCKLKMIFWVRTLSDMFFEQELEEIKEKNPQFSYDLYLTQEQKDWYHFWRITSKITADTILGFEEFYICGSPMMVDDMLEILQSLWIQKEQIFTEKY